MSCLLATQTVVRLDQKESACGVKSPDSSFPGFAELSSYCTCTRSAPALSKTHLLRQWSVVCSFH